MKHGEIEKRILIQSIIKKMSNTHKENLQIQLLHLLKSLDFYIDMKTQIKIIPNFYSSIEIECNFPKLVVQSLTLIAKKKNS